MRKRTLECIVSGVKELLCSFDVLQAVADRLENDAIMPVLDNRYLLASDVTWPGIHTELVGHRALELVT